MSLTTVHQGEWDYYQREVTHDVEAYFQGRGEEPGRWLGAGSAAAGLVRTVLDGQLGRLFDEGCHRCLPSRWVSRIANSQASGQ